MSRCRFFLALALALVFSVAIVARDARPACAVPLVGDLSMFAGYGPVAATGKGSSYLSGGRSLGIDLTSPRAGGAFVLRGSLERFDHGPQGASVGSAVFDGGRLVLPATGFFTVGEWNAGAIEMGLRRSYGTGRVRASVEGLTGAAIIESRSGSMYQNDRRADPTLAETNSTSHEGVPAFTIGTGLEVRGPWRTGVVASVTSEWSSIRGLAGPRIPLRFGARWPVEASTGDDGSTGRERLILSAGASVLRAPSHLRHDASPGLSASVAIDLPVRSWAAISIEGVQAVGNDEVPETRLEMDEFGNLVSVATGGEVPLSLTTTVLTAGLRVRRDAGAVAPFLRAGLGWGRTGGFGYDLSVSGSGGAYLDPHGNWVPVSSTATTVAIAGGAPSSGLAFSTGAGIEVRVSRSAHAVLEVGAVGVHRSGEDVLFVPLRLGVALP